MRHRLLSLLLLLGLLAACADQSPPPAATPPATEVPAPEVPAADRDEVEIKLVSPRACTEELNRCYDTEVTIDGSGKIVYSACCNSTGVVRTESQVSAEAVAQLVAAFEQARFFELQDKYRSLQPCCIGWDSSWTISIRSGARAKAITLTHAYGPPSETQVPAATAQVVEQQIDQLGALRQRVEELAASETHLATLIPQVDPAPQEGVQVKWYIGLNAGNRLHAVDKEPEIAQEFNEAHLGAISLWATIIPHAEAYRLLEEQILQGTPPDIVGPVGFQGIETFKEHLLPLDELIARHGVDLSAYDEASLRPFRNAQGQLIALPYAIFPSFIYFNKDLFDAAGLPYPPQRFGELYQGRAWDMDALRDLALRLTLDANGSNAAEPGFDPTQILQYGFIPQWQGGALNTGAFFGAGDLTGHDDEATIPVAWRDAWRWFYQGRHMDHFIPDATVESSEAFGAGNMWSTGKVAMAWTHLWYTCCFTNEQVPRWDLAVVPSYNGTPTAKLHADTFAIMKTTQHPDAAFKAYLFLLNNHELRELYGGLSPVKAEQPAYFATFDQKFAPNQVTWQVALDSLAYADVPSHEQHLPNQLKAQDRLAAFEERVNATPGLDLDREIAQLERDLTAIFQQ